MLKKQPSYLLLDTLTATVLRNVSQAEQINRKPNVFLSDLRDQLLCLASSLPAQSHLTWSSWNQLPSSQL